MRRRRFRRFLRNENGSIIVETALMITILLLLTFGIVDMGRALYVSNTLILAARDGARWAVVHADDGNIISTMQRLLYPVAQKYPQKLTLVKQIGENEPAYLYKINY